jgi:hypothetical protein
MLVDSVPAEMKRATLPKVKRTSGLGVAAVEVRDHQVQIIRITLRATAVFHALVS